MSIIMIIISFVCFLAGLYYAVLFLNEDKLVRGIIFSLIAAMSLNALISFGIQLFN